MFYSNLYFDSASIGTNVTSLKKGGGWVTYSGTSMATPFVAGCVAILLEANPSLKGKPSAVTDYLRGSGDYVPGVDVTATVWSLFNFENYYLDGFQPNIKNLVNLNVRTQEPDKEEMHYIWYQTYRG